MRDAVRGLTVLEMESVNLSKTMLFHAPIGCNHITYADTIFPGFVFLAGMSPCSWRRSVGLMGLGLAYNSVGIIGYGVNYKDYQPRYLGVLQRTGLSLLILNGLVDNVIPERYYPAVITSTWLLLTTFLAKDKANPLAIAEYSAQTSIDTAVFSPYSLYRKEYDPEGLLGALTTSLNVWAGRYIAQQANDYLNPSNDFKQSSMLGLGCMAVGTILSRVFPRHVPLSKPYWTPTFALVSGGFTLIKYSAVAKLLPYLPGFISHGLECLGRRSIEIYFTSALLHNLLRGTGISSWIRRRLTELVGARVADIVCVCSSNVLMTILATQYVKYGIRLVV